MKSVYNIEDFIPVKNDDLQVVESVNGLLHELGINKTLAANQIDIAKDVIIQRVKKGLERIEELVKEKQEDRIDEVISALGLSKTLTINQLELVKDVIVQRVKVGDKKIDELIKLVGEKNYSPVIENIVKTDQPEVMMAISEMRNDVVKALNDLRNEIARKKKWEFKVYRDSAELITSLTATEK